jgi:hypothetical protein
MVSDPQIIRIQICIVFPSSHTCYIPHQFHAACFIIQLREYLKLLNDDNVNGENRNIYKILEIKPEGKKPLGRPRRSRVDNIKIDLIEIGWYGTDWVDLTPVRDHWRALMNTIMNLRVPWNVGAFLSSCTTGGFSRRARLHEVS